MSPGQREVFEQNLKSAEEVTCTLVYEDGWSLLRPNKQQVCGVTMKADTESIYPGGGVLPYKGLMGTCGQPGYVFRDFCLKQGVEFIIFCLNQGIDLSLLVLNRMSFLGR